MAGDDELDGSALAEAEIDGGGRDGIQNPALTGHISGILQTAARTLSMQ